ncbi:MAG: signal peptide peptidase SppA [Pyrinomonadaceae bacterium]
MSRTRKIVLVLLGVITVFVVVAAIGIALLYLAFRQDKPSIKDNSVLTLKIKGAMPDYAPNDPTRRFFGGGDEPSMAGVLTEIKKAKVDKRIGAILLDIDERQSAGWAKADELRDAIADFRTSGKPIYAFMELATNKEYYIATACERIYFPPSGTLFINGLAANVTFFRGSLDKLGIYPDTFQIGKYKNAPESFTRKNMSDAQREVTNALIDDQFNRYVNAIATTRGKSVEDVRAMIDNAPYVATEAKAAGLIDGANYRDEVENELKKRLGYKDSEKLHLLKESEYRNVTPESLDLNEGERVAVIYATGAIGSGKSSGGSPFDGQSVGSDSIVKALKDARDDTKIRAIVLRVDSPGGLAYSSDVIWHAVEAAKQKKPVVVSMSDVAASGGYYIAAAASKIVAEPSTITGSIGAFAGKPVIKGFYEWLGISSEYVLRGKNAGLFRETEAFTKDERARFESWIKSSYYDDFVPKVAKGRNRNAEYIDSIGQGRVWSGAQGKENGLVDEFGGMDRAIEVAKQLANIPANKGVRRVILPEPRNFFQQWFSDDDDEDEAGSNSAQQQRQRAMLAALPEDLRRAFQYAAVLDQMKRGEVMLMMPFDLRIK